MKKTKKVEIGIYKTYSNEYFALGISGYKMRKIKSDDKHCLAFKIRDKLNRKGIEHCFIYSIKNGSENCPLITESELEIIAGAISNYENLKIKVGENLF